jgi:hypothetical protein
MYTSGSFPLVLAGYEWQALRSLGKLGLQAEIGLANLDGKGRFKIPNGGRAVAREGYQLYVVPLTAMVSYKFEYFDKQALVPFVSGAFTYYGMAEKREDRDFVFAGSPAVGGGGGFNISLVRIDPDTAYVLASDYGLADFWITFEGRYMQGLDLSKDFSNTMFSFGFTADY